MICFIIPILHYSFPSNSVIKEQFQSTSFVTSNIIFKRPLYLYPKHSSNKVFYVCHPHNCIFKTRSHYSQSAATKYFDVRDAQLIFQRKDDVLVKAQQQNMWFVSLSRMHDVFSRKESTKCNNKLCDVCQSHKRKWYFQD